MLKFVIISLWLATAIGYYVPSEEYDPYIQKRYYQKSHQRNYEDYSLEGSVEESTFHHDVDVLDVIKKLGYKVEMHTVVTVDGYKLGVIHIGPKVFHYDSYQPSSEEESRSRRWRKTPALLMPSIISNSYDFIIGGREVSLGAILADRGYDVYIPNVRGRRYSRNHTTLDPERDPAFWNFGWDDIVTKDMPAIIDFVLTHSKFATLNYVGHMHGAALFYAMVSEMPKYNKNVRLMIALGPMAYLKDTENLLVRYVKDHMDHEGWVAKHVGTNEFDPSAELIREGGKKDCMRQRINHKVCKSPYFLLNGYSTNSRNETLINRVLKWLPRKTGISAREIVHLAKMHKTGRFTNDKGVEYDFSKMTIPVIIYWAPHDKMSTKSDMDRLTKRIPSMRKTVRIPEFTDNLDMLFGRNVENLLYEKIIREMEYNY